MPIVLTSVAVAMPSTTAKRIRNGRISAGIATRKARPIAACWRGQLAARRSAACARQAMPARPSANTSAGSSPPVNSPAMLTPVTEPMVISTSEGGIVSLIAPEAASSETSSPSSAPRRFISGNSTGATAAISAALDPEMPLTSTMAPSST